MSSRTKEEEEALDEKIARIQRKNEEILRRQKEIEEDKRLAEQQNALVKLRPSSANISRERMPALKPSNREIRQDFNEDLPFQEPPIIQRSVRGSLRGRGNERLRGQGDWKASGGPPPDPKSFLYDDERDEPSKHNMDQRRVPERGQREERDDRVDSRGGGREFQRGRRRGGGEFRGERGRRPGGRSGGGRRIDEDEWRAERMRIDEARIQRQRAADGKWRREWDNDKVMQESLREPRQEARRVDHQEKWTQSGQLQSPPASSARQPFHGGSLLTSTRGGRGRGRLDPSELEMPIEKFQVEVLQSQTSPIQKHTGSFSLEDSLPSHRAAEEVISSHSHYDDFRQDSSRSVACVGNTVKVSIANTGAAQSTHKPQRQAHEPRGRFKSQTSYSSQSDDDSPRDKGHRGGRRQRTQKVQKDQAKHQVEQKNIVEDKSPAVSELETLPVQNKPPLPPFRSERKTLGEIKDSNEIKDGDESWEDVTSGAESVGEEFSSVHSSPLRNNALNTVVLSGEQSEQLLADVSVTGLVQSLECSENIPSEEYKHISYEEYLNKLDTKADDVKGDAAQSTEQLQQIYTPETSCDNISLDTSDNIFLNASSLEDTVGEGGVQPPVDFPDNAKSLIVNEKQCNTNDKEKLNDHHFKVVNEDETVPKRGRNNESAGSLASSTNQDDKEKHEFVKLDMACISGKTDKGVYNKQNINYGDGNEPGQVIAGIESAVSQSQVSTSGDISSEGKNEEKLPESHSDESGILK